MHEAKDSRLQKKNELTLTSMQLNHLCNSASNQCRTSPIYFFKRQFYSFFPHVTVLKSENEGSVTNTKTFIMYSPWVHKIGSNRLCCHVTMPEDPSLLLLQQRVGLIPPQD